MNLDIDVSGDDLLNKDFVICVADNIANIYRKEGLKSKARKQKGIKLNLQEINYKMIVRKWNEIDEKIK